MSKRKFIIKKLMHPKKKHLVSTYNNIHKILLIIFIIITLSITALFGILLIIFTTLPDIDNIQNLVAAQSSVIYDREGNILYTIHGEENRKNITLNQISSNAVNAVLAIEDDQFYQHSGIDLGAILKAICSEIYVCRKSRGGSTITQQYIKNAFLNSERKYSRKLREIMLALQLENRYSKDQILEMYLNRIPYGANIFGIETAAQTFFNKSAKDLSVAEGAILAAIPKAPTYFSPYGSYKYAKINLDTDEIIKMNIYSEQDLINHNPKFISKGLLGKSYIFGENENQRNIYIKGRTDFVLNRMQILGFISESEVQTALEEIKLKKFIPYHETIFAPHFVMYIREILEQKYGKEQIEKGGLKITTTLDSNLQTAAEKAIETYGDTNEKRFQATNASLLSINPNNGQILAMVGSRDYWNDEIDGKVNVALRPRLPGSSFKPIAYAAAFLQGYAPSTVLYDVKTKFGDDYEPENFDGEFRGPVSIRQALAHSINIPAVKATYLAGVSNVIDLARKMGIQLNQPSNWYGVSLGLGAGEARLIDITTAYSIFANGGYKTSPIAILKVEDKKGNILEEYQPLHTRELILDPQIAYLINNILSDIEARPEGYWREQLSIPGQINAAKTGTSNKKKKDINYPFDTWTVGYTRQIATGVWAGNNDGSHLSLKASGLDTAGRIWHDFMVVATKNLPREPFEQPDGIKWVNIAKQSGKLPSGHTPEEEIKTAVFSSFSVPREYDESYQLVEIDKVSEKLATEFTPQAAREMKAYYRHHSILSDKADWEDAVRQWAEENGQDEELPTEYDDIHTEETMDIKPQINIISPVTQSTVSAPYIGVWVDIKSPAGISKVDYFWDNKIIDTVAHPPYKGQLKISRRGTQKGSTHTIKAVVYDELYRSNQSSVIVKIGDDNIPPIANFVYPADNTTLIANSSMTAQVKAYDPNGDILKVEFYFDDKLQDTIKTPPYLWQFTVPDILGDHNIKAIAYDHAKNAKETKINIKIIQAEPLTYKGNSRILKPRKNATLDEGEHTIIKIYLDPEAQKNMKELTVFAKKTGIRSFEIAKAQGSSNNNTTNRIGAQTYTFIWDSPPSGRYELSLKIIMQDGKIWFSEKIPVVVR